MKLICFLVIAIFNIVRLEASIVDLGGKHGIVNLLFATIELIALIGVCHYV